MSIYNSYIRKQILNQRYVNSLQQKYSKEIRAMFRRVSKRIAKEPNSERLLAIRADLAAMINAGVGGITQQMMLDINDFAVDEADFTARIIKANSKVALRIPSANDIKIALSLSSLSVQVGTMTMADALSNFAQGQTRAIQRIISDSILFGDTIRDIVKQVDALQNGRPIHQVRALTRTLANHASAQTKRKFMDDNKDAFDGEEWTAVLDGRTTDICAGLDGTIYPVGQGRYPPAHWNCRSLRVPVLSSEFNAVTNKTKRKDFDGWLKEQDKDFQDEYFSQFIDGKTKAELFRRGGLEMQNFTDDGTRSYTRQELIALYPKAFDKANLTTGNDA